MTAQTNGRRTYLQPPQIKRLVDHCRNAAVRADGNPRKAEVDWLVVALGLGAGLTVAELTTLRVGDCHTDGNSPSIHVRCGKGGVPGDVAISAALVDHLRRFVALKADWGQDVAADAYVLATGTGKPYTRSALQKRFKAVATAAGLPGVSIQSLRRTFCAELLRRTGNLKLVQVQARHARLASTAALAEAQATGTLAQGS
jgi:integrase